MPGQFGPPYQFFGNLVDLAMESGEIIIADLFATDSDALVDSYQMRRGVQTGLQLRGAKNGGQRGSSGSLAVRSSDQNAGELSFGMPQSSQQDAHVLEVELMRRGIRQFVPQGKHARDCGFVGHKSAVSFQPSGIRFSYQITAAMSGFYCEKA